MLACRAYSNALYSLEATADAGYDADDTLATAMELQSPGSSGISFSELNETAILIGSFSPEDRTALVANIFAYKRAHARGFWPLQFTIEKDCIAGRLDFLDNAGPPIDADQKAAQENAEREKEVEEQAAQYQANRRNAELAARRRANFDAKAANKLPKAQGVNPSAHTRNFPAAAPASPAN
jgi:hypothetical protein